MRPIRFILTTMILLAPLPVLAEGADNAKTPDTSSSVDPAGQKAATQGSRPATPGTVGAMNGTEQGSFTATKKDQGKAHLK